MAISGSLQFSHDLGFCRNQTSNNNHNQFFKVLFLFLSFPFFLPFVVFVVVSSSSFFFLLSEYITREGQGSFIKQHLPQGNYFLIYSFY